MAVPQGNRPYLVYLGPVYTSEGSPGQSQLTAPTWTLATYLEPLMESVVANGEIGEARIIAQKHPEDLLSAVQLGQAVQIVNFTGAFQINDNTDPGIANGTVVFDGVVVKIRSVYKGDSEQAELICYQSGDFLLHRIGLHGQVRRGYTQEQYYYNNGVVTGSFALNYNPITGTSGSGSAGSSSGSPDVVTIDTPLIFNPDGEPNATQQTFFLTGSTNNNQFPIFEVPFRNQVNSTGTTLQAAYWTLSDAIQYLLNLTPASAYIDPASYGDAALNIFTTYGDPVVSNVNLEGKSLGQALADLLTPYNYGYWVEPGISAGTTAKHRIHFFQRGEGTTTQFQLEPRGTTSYASIANLIASDITYDATPTVNRIRAYGDRLKFITLAEYLPGSSSSSASVPSGCLKMVKGWQDSALVWAYGTDGVTVNPFDVTFRTNYCQPTLITPAGASGGIAGTYGIGRIWLVNLGEVPNQPLENLAQDLIQHSTPHNSIDPRRFEKPELYNQNFAGGLMSQEEVIVEMSTDQGQNWQVVTQDWYKVLPENLGIVFINPKMERLGLQISNQITTNGKSYWQALHDGTLALRVICSVKSDERVNQVVPNDGAAFPLACEGIYNNQGYRKFISNSNVASTLYYTKFPPQQVAVDDTNALGQVVDTSLECTDRIMTSGSGVLQLVNFGDWTPGMSISGIANRTTFPTPATILRVVYKFDEEHVEIVLDNKRVSSVIKSKAMTAASSYRQHQLGVENPHPASGANKVNYIPGDDDSFKQYMRESMGG